MGVGPQALVLRGLSPGQVAVLERLDGSRSRRQLEEVAAGFGDPPHVVEELLRVLRGAGVMADPGAERVDRLRRMRPTDRRILLGGPSILTDRLARALRLADIDGVLVGPWALDHAELGMRDRGTASTSRAPTPDLVILSGYDAIDPAEAAPWMRFGIPHLAFSTEGERTTIGPLVIPRRRGDTTCLHCVELHRCDRDSGRAAVLAQTARSDGIPLEAHHAPGLTALLGPGGPVQPSPVEPALLAAAASVAALVVAAYLSGTWLPDGVTVELTSPWPRLDHRRWPRHPHCPHHGQ